MSQGCSKRQSKEGIWLQVRYLLTTAFMVASCKNVYPIDSDLP